jgi:ribosome-associated toxin RatA of RatAB toxin-antitoxin module
MRDVQHSALVARPPRRLYELINDIDSYPQFVPWCSHARVHSRTEREIVATIGVRWGPLQDEFTTRNELEPDSGIRMHLVSGPFKMLEGQWLLSPLALTAGQAEGCRVQLTMRFALKNPLTALVLEQKFAESTSALIDAFVARVRGSPP